MSPADIILRQLGGGRFAMMTGAKHIFSDAGGRALVFQLPRTRGYVKDGINAVRIELDPSDTYTVTFKKIGTAREGYRAKDVASISMVYAEDLRRVFTSHTGLDTSL